MVAFPTPVAQGIVSRRQDPSQGAAGFSVGGRSTSPNHIKLRARVALTQRRRGDACAD
jgi:hypothetical protein